MIICGIDDAGRGPVLGPMVMAGCSLKEGEHFKLKNLQVKDSKLLTREKREELFEKIRDLCNTHYIIISVSEIDDKRINLNDLEAVKAAEIVNELCPERAIIDCPSPNTEAWKNYVKRYSNCRCEIIAEHKADFNHPIVSAASIIAKVIRDREIETIKNRIGIDFGSGYLTDPKTQDFMNNHFENYQELFRHSWAPIQEKLRMKNQKKLFEF